MGRLRPHRRADQCVGYQIGSDQACPTGHERRMQPPSADRIDEYEREQKQISQRCDTDPEMQEADQASECRNERWKVREQHQSLVKIGTPAQRQSAPGEQREGCEVGERIRHEDKRRDSGRQVIPAQPAGDDRGRNPERHDQGSESDAYHAEPAMPPRPMPDDQRRLGEEQPHPGEHDEAMHLYQHSELARVHEIPVLEAERPDHECRQDHGCSQEVAVLVRTDRYDGIHRKAPEEDAGCGARVSARLE